MSAVVVGVGNRMRGDDAAGPVAIDRLRQRVSDGARLVECAGDVAQLLGAWRDADWVIVVDAVVSGAEAGTLHVVDGRTGVPREWRSASTHLVGLAEAIELAWALDTMPHELTIFGVEAGCVEPGAGMTPAVDDTIDRIVERILVITDA